MDSLTQIVLGAAVGEAVLGKKIGNRAMLWGAVAGTIPDLDVLARYVTDTITATEIHRGFSHSLLFSIIMAPILGWLVHQITKREDLGYQDWTKLFFLGLFTHPLLDIFTTWGTQLFWPFKIRLAFNTIFVIDPLYTLPFLVCVLLAMTKNRDTLSRKRINKLGIYMSSIYLVIALLLKWNAHIKITKALIDQDINYTSISTRPSAMNTILWNANIDAGDNYLIGEYSLFDTKPPTFIAYPKNRKLTEDITVTEEVQRLITISQGWYTIEKKQDTWIFNDLRFGLIPTHPSKSQFVFSYTIEDIDGRIEVTENRPETRNISLVLENLWNRLRGN
ncbi:metal-dependent hydrolase [Dokdonia sp. Hel_I_53]|uniref:metal-dependent hydrolase n=1 Tax=Dokdonia sp. Hel_I_53 TaxID=1566287 RepID=UPI00119C7341|nr:metal-dependent hydrolase [Dokdonia sp. Hel_I_53]TVZ52409.1 inner membrane protein [Dokdonia sp. Hel_I_53]